MHKKAISLSDLTIRGHVGRIEAFVFLLSCPSSVPERYSLSLSQLTRVPQLLLISVSLLPSLQTKVNLPLLPLSRRSWSKYRPSGRGGRPVAQREQTLKPSLTSDLESGSGDRRAGSQASRVLSDKMSRRYAHTFIESTSSLPWQLGRRQHSRCTTALELSETVYETSCTRHFVP